MKKKSLFHEKSRNIEFSSENSKILHFSKRTVINAQLFISSKHQPPVTSISPMLLHVSLIARRDFHPLRVNSIRVRQKPTKRFIWPQCFTPNRFYQLRSRIIRPVVFSRLGLVRVTRIRAVPNPEVMRFNVVGPTFVNAKVVRVEGSDGHVLVDW